MPGKRDDMDNPSAVLKARAGQASPARATWSAINVDVEANLIARQLSSSFALIQRVFRRRRQRAALV
jgi:hypothetical protein